MLWQWLFFCRNGIELVVKCVREQMHDLLGFHSHCRTGSQNTTQ